jgi:hypothetical protein
VTEKKTGFCINCDNKHGCKSGAPPCIVEMSRNNISRMSGKLYLINERRAEKCRECSFFRSCWNAEEYDRLAD